MTITVDGGILLVGTKCIVIANILFLDSDDNNLYIIMSGRKTGHFEDTNNITVPYLSCTNPAAESASALKLAVVELIKDL